MEFVCTILRRSSCVALCESCRVVRVSTCVDETAFVGRVVLRGECKVTQSEALHRPIKIKLELWYM